MFEVNKRARGGKRALHGETKVVGSTQLHLYSFVAVAVTVTVEHVFTCDVCNVYRGSRELARPNYSGSRL